MSTNATNGFSLTTQANQSMLSGSDTLDDTICDNTTCSTTSPSAWGTADEEGFGFFCEDINGTPCAAAHNTNLEYAPFPCTGADGVCDPGTGGASAREIMESTGPANAEEGRIHYKITANAATTAAGVYSTTVTYIVTPTY